MSDPLTIVQQYMAAFNRGDIDAMAALSTVPSSILDGMAPHLWQGPTAPRDWYSDVLVEGEHLGASGYEVTLDAPLHNEVKDDAAYVVVPATMRFTLKDEPQTQSGAIFTVALRRAADEWRVAAWAWTKGVRAHETLLARRLTRSRER